jgi:hypothetical protein
MRLGLLGDVHAEDVRLSAALERFEREGVDHVLAVGDFVDGRGDVERTLRLLRDHGVLSVRGNHDRWLIHSEMRGLPEAHREEALCSDSLDWLRALPPTITLDSPAGPLLLCHGIGRDDMTGLRPTDEEPAVATMDGLQALVLADEVRLIVSGHTHERMVRRVGGLTLVNPGTLRQGDSPCVAVLDLLKAQVTFLNFDAEQALIEAERFDLSAEGFPA